MNRTLNIPSFSRPLWAEIDLGALRHNVRCLRSRNGGLILPVLKANAYGHGVIACAKALQSDLQEREMFCVASVDEGIELCAAGIDAPILLLSALLPSEAESSVEHNLTATISSLELATALNDAARNQNKDHVTAHLKIDSGMGRLGVASQNVADLWNKISQLTHLKITGIYTHFACADEEEDEMTCEQNELFKKMLQYCGVDSQDKNSARPMLHAANSAAAWRYPLAAFDAVRPGISTYGVSPFASKALSATLHAALRPVMQLKAKVTLTKQLAAGASVSYGATWRAKKATRLAVIPIGYADGYHRSLSNSGEVLLRGQLCSVVGRVTMDQSIIDVTALNPAVQIGEEATLWGGDLPVENVAAWAKTIGYEMLTGVAARVPRVYK
ncbi:MAG: alanine racemase [Abditibacteriaceae bacterium]